MLRCSVKTGPKSARRASSHFNSMVPGVRLGAPELWNCKVLKAQALAVAEHLGEDCSFKGMARLVRVDPGTVHRLCRQFGRHVQQFHDGRARELVVDSLQADERHGFVGRRKQEMWEAEL